MRSTEQKRLHNQALTKHHIVPTSRLAGKPILNVCKVPSKQHELYHHLFGNMLPEEILEYLNKEFWNSNYEITIS